MVRVLVLGMDGGSFNIINPLVKDGKLPNIYKLIRGGVYGVLESTNPPVTAPAWVSFATGKNPGKHGCFDFLLPRETLNQFEALSSNNINGETFYEVLNRKGRTCILVHLPYSSPPRIRKTLITSWMTKGDNFVFPPELVEKIPELKNYRHIPDTSLRDEGKLEDYFRDIRSLERTRFICAKELFKEDWDFFFFLFDGSDRIQHVWYGEMLDYVSSGKTLTEPEWLKAFKDFDSYVGWFLDNAPKDTNTFLISDHGFNQYDGVFFLNKWLRNEGYLKVKLKPGRKERLTGARGLKSKLSLFLIKHQALTTFLYRVLRISFLRNTSFGAKLIETTSLYASDHLTVDVSKTVAFCTTNRLQGIYINDKKRFKNSVVSDEEYEKIREEIIRKLRNLTEPRNDRALLKAVNKKEEVYFGECVADAPDIVFELNNYWIKRDHESPTTILDKKHYYHSKEGIFIAYGPDIKENIKVNNIRVVDLAPTILHIMGIPVPKDMDGKVLKQIFRENSEPAQREVTFQKPRKRRKMKREMIEKEEEKIKERLKALGYVG